MDSDIKNAVAVLLGTAAIVLAISAGIWAYHYTYVSHGYEQCEVVGNESFIWKKSCTGDMDSVVNAGTYYNGEFAK